MRIAFIVGEFPALSETFILDQITGLIERGHDVDIFAEKARKESKVHGDFTKFNLAKKTHYRPPMPGNKLLRLLKGIFLAAIVFPKEPKVLFNSLNFFRYGREAISLHLLYAIVPFIRRKPYDIIHAHFGPNGLLAMRLQQIGVIYGKLITTFHGYDVNKLPRRFGNDLYKLLFRNCELFTVNTKFTGNVVENLGCPINKIVRMPVGLKLRDYVYSKRNLDDKNQIRILTVARLVEKKGIEFSIRAVANLVSEYPHLSYKILGTGPLHKKLGTLIEELGVSKNIKLIGPGTHDEVIKWYASSHLFVLASVTGSDGDMEGQGLVIQEAQATGLPVVSTLHNGIPEGILDSRSGFLVPEKDVSALVEKLRYLILHPEKWSDMGRAGRTFVENHYNIDILNDRLVEIYKGLINNS